MNIKKISLLSLLFVAGINATPNEPKMSKTEKFNKASLALFECEEAPKGMFQQGWNDCGNEELFLRLATQELISPFEKIVEKKTKKFAKKKDSQLNQEDRIKIIQGSMAEEIIKSINAAKGRRNVDIETIMHNVLEEYTDVVEHQINKASGK